MKAKQNEKVVFKSMNFIILGIAAILIFAGFVLLEQNSLTFGPIVLVFAYCAVIPFAIMFGIGKDNKTE